MAVELVRAVILRSVVHRAKPILIHDVNTHPRAAAFASNMNSYVYASPYLTYINRAHFGVTLHYLLMRSKFHVDAQTMA
jgi:hypothetical protein